MTAGRVVGGIVGALSACLACAGVAAAQVGPMPASLTHRADSLYRAGDWQAARDGYAGALAADPDNSHAVYRLGQLADTPGEALRQYRRYVALEPQDPWGYIAVGATFAKLGSYHEALSWYERASARAPRERDVAIGRARVLARAHRTDEAADAYTTWVGAHPNDAEAWRELGREELKAARPAAAARALEHALALQPDGTTSTRLAVARALAAPAVEPMVGGSRDSDGNIISRVGLKADVSTAGGAKLGLAAEHQSLADGLDIGSSDEFTLYAGWRPRATLRLEAAGGINRVASSAKGAASATIYPAADLRLRFRPSGAGPRLDLRAQHDLLALSPILLANRVTRSEVSGRLELPAGPIVLRALGRAGVLAAGTQDNRRGGIGGGVAIPLGPAVELSGQYQRLAYAEASNAGYFSPRVAEVIEAGWYAEVEPAPDWSLALDVGAGAQRAADQGAPMGAWRSAFRFYALSSVALAAGRDLRLEVEAYDAPLATVAAVTAQGWRWGSASLSLRWALPR